MNSNQQLILDAEHGQQHAQHHWVSFTYPTRAPVEEEGFTGSEPMTQYSTSALLCEDGKKYTNSI